LISARIGFAATVVDGTIIGKSGSVERISARRMSVASSKGCLEQGEVVTDARAWDGAEGQALPTVTLVGFCELNGSGSKPRAPLSPGSSPRIAGLQIVNRAVREVNNFCV
jgi:hypothetical protein